ncbi:MAG TPA: 4a-hydroxytetrahydrobiopterin dehydratase [Thermoanaerobaculia bacterium]|nr:4a-hydroxytetrahydrobiopterin dehydratase [Thermoanaerobaculia bacterium]
MEREDREPACAAAGPVERLKPERVQEGLAARLAHERNARITVRLRSLAGWKFAQRGKAITRVRVFRETHEAVAFAAFAAQSAASHRQPLRLAIAEGRVIVTLQGRKSRGVTQEVLDLAATLG